MTEPIDHDSEFDPISYIRAIGLQPEDTYGFLPIEHQDITPYFFLYRDRPEYKERRDALPLSHMRAGAIPMPNEQQVKLDMDRDLPGGSEGRLGQKVSELTQIAEAFGGQPLSEWNPADAPDPAKLQKLAKLLENGDITPQEYQQLLQKQMATPAAPPEGLTAPASPASPPAGSPPEAGSIVAQRIYPGMGRSIRASNRQLDKYLPDYRKELQLRPEDTYGVLPRVTRMSHSTDGDDDLEWDDFWIVYRDRPEYAQGREAWAANMNKKGDWPDPVVLPGVSEPSGAPFDNAKVKTEKDVWPRELLVMRKRSSDLGDAIRKKISKWGFEPEDSFGFAPSYANESIYFAWRKT